MLELLSGGVDNKVIAKKMGYTEGTMRVYLHDLYRKIGVRNKTAAVVWHFDRTGVRKAGAMPPAALPAGPTTEECFGDYAQRANLHSALGAMNMFLGPFGRLWQVAARLKGGGTEDGTEARRRATRALWEALLYGDSTSAPPSKPELESPTEIVLRAVLALVTGQKRTADAVITRMVRRGKDQPRIPESERTLVLALRDAIAGEDDALACLRHLATEKSSPTLLRQVAVVALFHAYRARKDPDRARDAANALCAMAEDTRQHLQAMGERPLYRSADVPMPLRTTPRSLASYLKKLGGARLATVEE
ncbi:hypothetical protein BWI17_18755 [Betaproteobacteria bacterium GR16-43]|nr:hypothetical protein BWI17_18755 [Betaproteobacteria bacterium GR16-43]